MKYSIHPSPAIIVRADEPIADCVRLMSRHRVGSVLVVSDKVPPESAELVGIFTERDLLNKIDLIQNGGHWRRPIRTVMAKPVRTLHISKLDQAGELMLKFEFRHVPIVILDKNSRPRVAGVISMRDLFRKFVAAEARAAVTASRIPLTIDVLSTDPHLIDMLKQSFSFQPTVKVREFERKNVSKVKLFVLDLDYIDARDWAELLREVNRRADEPIVAALYNPILHGPDVVKVLTRLQRSKNLAIFPKPVAIPELIARISSLVSS